MAALTVSTVSGSCVLSVDDGGTFDTVADLKLAIQDRLGVGRFQQRLTIGECVLDDGLPLGSLRQQPLRLGLVVLPYKKDDATVEALVDAIWTNNAGGLERVLRLPANPNGPPGSPADQRSPLHEATDFGCAHMVRLFLGALADPNVADNRHGVAHTALHAAAAQGCEDVVQALCVGRACVDTRDADGLAPIAVAVREGHEEVVQQLRAAAGCTLITPREALTICASDFASRGAALPPAGDAVDAGARPAECFASPHEDDSDVRVVALSG